MRKESSIEESKGTVHGVIQKFMRVMKIHKMILENKLNKSGVYRSQHQLLMYIFDNPHASQKEIAIFQNVSPAAIAVSVKKLEKGGYIKRVIDEEDNRANKICITEKGINIIEYSKDYFTHVEKVMFSGFSENELGQLGAFLDRIFINIQSLSDESKSREDKK